MRQFVPRRRPSESCQGRARGRCQGIDGRHGGGCGSGRLVMGRPGGPLRHLFAVSARAPSRPARAPLLSPPPPISGIRAGLEGLSLGASRGPTVASRGADSTQGAAERGVPLFPPAGGRPLEATASVFIQPRLAVLGRPSQAPKRVSAKNCHP